MERCGDTGRSLDAGPYPNVGGDSTEVQCIAVYGVFERQERHDDIRATCEPEVQIRQPALLGGRVLCEHRGIK